MKAKKYYLNKEIRDERYRQLIDLLKDICSVFSLSVYKDGEQSKKINNFINGLNKYKISKDSNEAQKTIMYSFKLNSESVEIIKNVTDSIYGWLQPYLPEDLCFYRNDGSVVLDSLTHHKIILINLTMEEAKILLVGMPDYWSECELKTEFNHKEYTKEAIVPDITKDFIDKCKGFYLYDKTLSALNVLVDLMKAITYYGNKKTILPWSVAFYMVAEIDEELISENNNVKAQEAYYYSNAEKKYKILLEEKERAENKFLSFAKEHIKNADAYFQHTFDDMTKEYSQIIDIAPFANKYYWEDKFFNLIELRNDIYYAIKFLHDRKIGVNLASQIDKLRNVDSRLQSECKITPPINSWIETFRTEHPKSHWWWYVGNLKSLSKKDLETI